MLDDNPIRTPYGQLPAVVRVLNVSDQSVETTSWLESSLANDSAMAVKLESADMGAAITLLRQEFFDAVIVHHTEKLNALDAIHPLRTASPDELAVVVCSLSILDTEAGLAADTAVVSNALVSGDNCCLRSLA